MANCFVKPNLAANARPKGSGPPDTGFYFGKIVAKAFAGDRMQLDISLPGGFVRKGKAVWLPANADGTPLPGLEDWQLADRVNDLFTTVIAQKQITAEHVTQMKTDGFSDDWVQVGSEIGCEWQSKESMGNEKYGSLFFHPATLVAENIANKVVPANRGAAKTTTVGGGSAAARPPGGGAPPPPPSRGGGAPTPPAAPPTPASRPGGAPAPPPPPNRA